MDARTEQYVQELEQEVERQRGENDSLAENRMSMYTQPSEENLIQYQLDLKEDLDKIYHLLNGDQPKYSETEGLTWREPEDDDLKPFNEFGVQLLMQIISFYLNRNTLLSNYDQETINKKMLDFGIEISDLIYTRFEEMGMDTEEKIKLFPMIFRELVDVVHSAYQRSLKGMERESIRTGRVVTQSGQIGDYNSPQRQPGNNPRKQFSLVNPRTWFG